MVLQYTFRFSSRLAMSLSFILYVLCSYPLHVQDDDGIARWRNEMHCILTQWPLQLYSWLLGQVPCWPVRIEYMKSPARYSIRLLWPAWTFRLRWISSLTHIYFFSWLARRARQTSAGDEVPRIKAVEAMSGWIHMQAVSPQSEHSKRYFIDYACRKEIKKLTAQLGIEPRSLALCHQVPTQQVSYH